MAAIKTEEHSLQIVRTVADVERDELLETRNDIRKARAALDQFTMGDMLEGVYGDDYAAAIRHQIGEDLYNKRMGDVSMHVELSKDGLKTRMADTPVPVTQDTPESKAKLVEALDRQEAEIDTQSLASLANTLSEMSEQEREALFSLAERMSKKAPKA